MNRLILIVVVLLSFDINGQETNRIEYAEKLSLEIAEKLQRERYDDIIAHFDDNLTAILDKGRITALMGQLHMQYGQLDSILLFTDEVRAETINYRRGLMFGPQKFDLIFSLDKENKINSFRLSTHQDKSTWMKPTYVDMEKFSNQTISIGEEDPLLGEISLPNTSYKVMVVLVHGSGPNNMNERLGPNELFKDLAYGLATNGIACLRYNKRTYDYQSKMAESQSEIGIDEVVVNDAILAIKKAQEKNVDKVILIGHSMGGHMAPKIAANANLDGVIVMAGNSGPLIDLILPQIEHIYENDPESSLNEFKVNMVKAQIKTVQDGNFDESTSVGALPLGLPAKFWISLQGYEPAKLAKKQDIPYLVLNGERDYQVTPQEAQNWNIEKKGEKSKLIIYPKLNHMFFAGEGVCIPSEYQKVGHLDEKVLSDIIEWINAL